MKDILFICLLLAAAISPEPAFASSICDSPTSRKVLQSVTTDPANTLTEKLLSDLIGDRPITFIGEAHYNTDTNALKKIIETFAKSRPKSCVAFEFAQTNDSYLSVITKIRNGLPKIREQAQAAERSEADRKALLDYAKSYEMYVSYFGPLADKAEQLNLATKAVDHVDHPFKARKSMDERNHAMAENLAALLASNACDSVLFIVGKAHIAPTFEATTGVQSLLETKFNINSISFNAQMTNETIRDFRGLTFPTCAAPSVAKAMIVKSALLDPALELMPLLEGSPRWVDFDYTILLPSSAP
ncbi:MAG: hypothetical protein V4760_03205 [Bdellovibrionota bacterium]